jgi:tetratricopeptide (TPR) repeat protein
MLGDITVYETDFEKAQAWLEESLDDYSKVGNRKAIVNILHALSWIAWVKGDTVQAMQEIDEALQISHEIGERYLYSSNLVLHSDIHLSMGSYEDSAKDVETAQKIGQTTGDKTVLAFVSCRKGRIYWINQQLDLAFQILNEALNLGREDGNKYTVAFSLYYLGRVATDRHDFALAMTYYRQSIQAFYEMNFWYWDYLAFSLEGLARAACLQKRYDRAAQFFGSSERFFQNLVHTLSPIERAWRQADLDLAKESLGEDRFQAMWQKGNALSPEQVIASVSGKGSAKP